MWLLQFGSRRRRAPSAFQAPRVHRERWWRGWYDLESFVSIWSCFLRSTKRAGRKQEDYEPSVTRG